MMKALCLAGESGVDVRLIMPGIPDHKFAYLVAESYFDQFMAHDVKIYTFTPGPDTRKNRAWLTGRWASPDR